MEAAHLFLDTNVLLHYEALDGIQWRGHANAERVYLHIAQSVLDEISLKKDMGESKSLRKRAGRIAKRLLECLDVANPFTLREGEFLLLESETPRMEQFSKLNPLSKDDQLIASALTFKDENSVPCYIVTGDSSLALRVKIKQWPLEHLAAPDVNRLPDERDKDERENAALRQKLENVKRAQPKLELTFLDGRKVLRFKHKIEDIEALVKELSDAERKENRFYTVPTSDSEGEADIRKTKFPGIKILPTAFVSLRGTKEEIIAYNEALTTYFSEYEAWVRTRRSIRLRTVTVELQVTNSGTLPAKSVHVRLHFPDGFKL